jgi:hypothetical protein
VTRISEGRRRWTADALALLFLAVLALAFFWPVTLNLGWIPHGGGDLVSFLWPTYSYAAQSLRAGRVPLWNPTLYSGAPFAADNQSGLFYPPNLLIFLTWPGLPYQALEWLVVGHVWWAGAGLYALVRVLLGQTLATERAPAMAGALVAAVAFMFSDVFVTHVGNLNIVAVSAWLPWCLLALHLALARRSAGWAAAAGAGLGVAALAGHAQMTLIVALALGLYGIAWILGAWPQGRRALAVRAGLVALTFVVALGVAALSVIPAAEMTRYTGRARLDYASATEFSLPWAGLAGLFSPLVFGRGAAQFWAPWDRVETGYAGAVTLLLAAVGLLSTRGWVRAWWLGLGAFGLLVALGPQTPIHRVLYAIVPGFASLRVPARFILLTDFALAALAGFGVYLLRTPTRRQLLAVGGAVLAVGIAVSVSAFYATPGSAEHTRGLWAGLAVFALLVVVGGLLATQAVRPGTLAALVALAAIDVIGHGAWVEVERSDPTRGFDHPAVVEFLRPQPGPVRIDNAAGAWSPDAAARLGLEDAGGLHNPLALAAYDTYRGAVGARGSPLYNFLNIQFVISDKGQPPGDASFVPVFDQDPTVDVYLNTRAQPRARLVYDMLPVDSGEAAFGAIHGPGFDPEAQVVIDTSRVGPPPATNGPNTGGASNLYYLDYQPERFTLVAETPGAAYLVMSEVWYPGWRAWLDGEEVPVYLADFAFRAVFLPAAGTHTLAMRFEPVTWKAGLTVTVVTWLALAAWGASALAVRRRAGRAVPAVSEPSL